MLLVAYISAEFKASFSFIRDYHQSFDSSTAIAIPRLYNSRLPCCSLFLNFLKSGLERLHFLLISTAQTVSN